MIHFGKHLSNTSARKDQVGADAEVLVRRKNNATTSKNMREIKGHADVGGEYWSNQSVCSESSLTGRCYDQ